MRLKYARAKLEIIKISRVIKQSWKAMIITLILAFILFIAAVKFFDKYIF
jgi:hypothetical protein